jgi:hypothetical protein
MIATLKAPCSDIVGYVAELDCVAIVTSANIHISMKHVSGRSTTTLQISSLEIKQFTIHPYIYTYIYMHAHILCQYTDIYIYRLLYANVDNHSCWQLKSNRLSSFITRVRGYPRYFQISRAFSRRCDPTSTLSYTSYIRSHGPGFAGSCPQRWDQLTHETIEKVMKIQ